MIRRVSRLFIAEMSKVWRTKFPYLGLVASALMALIARQSVEMMAQPDEITAASYFTASINMSTTIIIPIFATIFAAMLVASESSRGTFRGILTRPVRRTDFLTAKLISALFYLVLLFAANVSVALFLAQRYPLKTLADENVNIPGGPQQVSIFVIALLLTMIPQFATVCFGFFVSVMSRNVASAIGVAVGLLLSIQPMKEFIRFGEIELETWLFSSYYDTAIGIADKLSSGIPEVWLQDKILFLLGTSLVSIVIFLGTSYFLFNKRDLNY